MWFFCLFHNTVLELLRKGNFIQLYNPILICLLQKWFVNFLLLLCFNITPFIIPLFFFKNPCTAQAYYRPILSRFQIVTALLSLLKLTIEGFKFWEFFSETLFEKKNLAFFSSWSKTSLLPCCCYGCISLIMSKNLEWLFGTGYLSKLLLHCFQNYEDWNQKSYTY